ncbi:unnamed protein product [Choristocarpus tenellus]
MTMWIQVVFFVVWAQGAAAVTFSSGTDLSTSASEAQTVFAADLDGDGDLDVLSASWEDDTIQWYENEDGFGQFSQGTVISSKVNGAGHVFAADLDGDGDMDVLATSFFDDYVVWYENEGGEFFEGVVITSMMLVEPYALYVEDLDNDGDKDILTGSFDTGLIVWFENVNGNFTTNKTITLEAKGVWSVSAVDIDGDGDMDVLSASRIDGSVRWFENLDGLGNFTNGTVIASDVPEVYSIYAADLDGDEDLDVVSANHDNHSIRWYENIDGNGTFSSGTDIFSEALGAYYIYAADLDGDGDIDVLSASFDDDSVRWYENLGSGTFSSDKLLTSEAEGSTSVIAVDLDGDGDIDVLSTSADDHRVTWYENISSSSSSFALVIGLAVGATAVVLSVSILVWRRLHPPSPLKVCQRQTPMRTSTASFPFELAVDMSGHRVLLRHMGPVDEGHKRGKGDVQGKSRNQTDEDGVELGMFNGLDDCASEKENHVGVLPAVVVGSGILCAGVDNIGEIGSLSEMSKRVASAALQLASSSTLPLLKETATLIGMMATLTTDYKENERDMAKSLRWCDAMLKMLEEVSSQKTLSAIVTDLLEDAHSSIEDLVKIVQCFLAKGTMGRMFSSTLFKRRQAEAEEALRDTLQRLQTGMALEALNVARKTSTAVDSLVQSQELQRKAAQRKRRRAAMLQQHEVPEDQVTFFPDVAKLGKGGFGTVELVEYNGHLAAAKVVDFNDLDNNAPAAERLKTTFAKELHVMVLLRSEYTVNVYGAITKSPGRLVLLMEFMEGGDLRSLLSKDSAPLEEHFSHTLTLDIALGMEYLHSKGMIHGDLKSANILLNNKNQAKIADFGTVRTVEEYTTLATLHKPGLTLKWSAPEVLNQERIRLESDVYSFGIVVWEIVTRKLPWADVGRPMDVLLEVCSGGRPDIPDNAPSLLHQLMQSCWASWPGDRPPFSKILTLLQDESRPR